MSVKLSKRTILLGLYVIGGLLLVASAVLWWDHRATDPQRVFWGMVDRSMKSSGATVESSQTGTGVNMHQTIQYSMGGQNMAHTITSLTQGGTSITNEIIGTPTADYTRYTSIKTDQLSASGKPLNFNPVLGIWAKSENGDGVSQSVSQAVLGTSLPLGGAAVPLASLPPAQRTKLMNQIEKDGVYNVDYATVKRKHEGGRLVYTYTVHVKPGAYATMMKQFGTSTGLHSFDNLDPAQYAGQPEFTLNMTIDARAHQLLKVSSEDGAVKQLYSGYDMPVMIKEPTQTITVAELQKRMQQLQQ